jgi:CsbD-like protein
MNWDRIEGNWKQFTGKAKEQWGKLTDDELTQISGNLPVHDAPISSLGLHRCGDRFAGESPAGGS